MFCNRGTGHKTLADDTQAHAQAQAAGILFTNGTHVLAAHQRKDGREIISGLGGKMETSDLTPYYAAVRETLEELFDIEPSTHLISRICADVQPFHIEATAGYTNHQLSFDDLEQILLIVSRSDAISPIYAGGAVPTIDELLLRRKPKKNSEVRALSIMAVSAAWNVDADFAADIQSIKH